MADLHELPQAALLPLMLDLSRAADGVAGKGGRVRTFDNGFVIEEMAQGPPSGKLAKPGKKVRFHPDCKVYLLLCLVWHLCIVEPTALYPFVPARPSLSCSTGLSSIAPRV